MFLSSKTVVTGLRSAVPVLSRSISTAATFDYRRLREKQKWGSPEPEDPDYLVFPNEKLGRDYDLNWCINSYRVTPKTWAYRNLHVRGLQMLASGRLDPSKALIVDTNENANHQTYFVQRGADAANPAPALPEGSDVLDKGTYQAIIREVRQYLSSIDELYVHDGAVGTNPGVSEVRSRVIADSAKSALFLRHIMSPVPHPAEVSEFQHPLTVYVASDIEITNIGKLRSPSYSLIDLDSGTIVINSPSPVAIRESLATAAAYLAFQQNALLLPCDSVVVGEAKPEIKLVFGNSAKNLNLHGAHHNIWSSSGLSRAWEGITYDSLPKGVSLQRGDLIEEVSKSNKSSGKRVTTSLKSALGQRAPSPSGVFFLVNEKSVSGVASVSSNQASNLLKKVYKSNPTAVPVNDIATKFEQLLKESSVPTFVVNEEQAAKDGALLEKIKSVSQKGASVSAADSKLFS